MSMPVSANNNFLSSRLLSLSPAPHPSSLFASALITHRFPGKTSLRLTLKSLPSSSTVKVPHGAGKRGDVPTLFICTPVASLLLTHHHEFVATYRRTHPTSSDFSLPSIIRLCRSSKARLQSSNPSFARDAVLQEALPVRAGRPFRKEWL